MQRTLASLILLLIASPLWGQITLAPAFSLGQRIVATTPAEAKAFDWSCPTADLLTDGGTCFVWAKPGKHTLTLITVDTEYTIRRFEKTFEVTDSPVPPTPATLRDLVTDSEAAQIADYLRALASQVGKISSTEQFWSVWQQTFPVAGNAKLDAALKARLDSALAAQKGLSVELLAIADEFDKDAPKPPTPPTPVVEGKRAVVIAFEAEDDNPEFSSLVVSLRKLGGPADAYLKAHGHELDILDDELIREPDSRWNALLSGQLDQLPQLFVIDPQTNAVLFKQVIASGTTADNIIERIRETGG